MNRFILHQLFFSSFFKLLMTLVTNQRKSIFADKPKNISRSSFKYLSFRQIFGTFYLFRSALYKIKCSGAEKQRIQEPGALYKIEEKRFNRCGNIEP